MPRRSYVDLARFGVRLVPPDDPRFPALRDDILSRPQPFPHWPAGDAPNAAVLLNESGKAILVLAYEWRFECADGTSSFARYENLSSSQQMDILLGRNPIPRDLGTAILAGSKRLLTEDGMFGNNLDVLPGRRDLQGLSYAGGGSGGRGSRDGTSVAAIELVLDLAIFEDGLCAGLDQHGLAAAITRSLEEQSSAEARAATAIRDGASSGAIFEMLVPLARESGPGPADRPRRVFQGSFVHGATHHLIHSEPDAQLAWFASFARASVLPLRKLE